MTHSLECPTKYLCIHPFSRDHSYGHTSLKGGWEMILPTNHKSEKNGKNGIEEVTRGLSEPKGSQRSKMNTGRSKGPLGTR